MKRKGSATIIVLILAGSLALGGCANPSTRTRDLSTISTVDGSDGKWYRSAGDAYDYPMTPEKTPDQWKAMTNVKDRLAAQQLPDDKLKTISTAGLVETCMNHPFYANYTNLGPNYLQGVELTLQDFNGYRELLTRENAATEIVRYYLSINANALCSNQEFARFRLSFIELISANDIFIQKMTKDERVAFMKAILLTVYQRDSFSYKLPDYISPALLLGRLLEKESAAFSGQIASDNDIKVFLSTGSMEQKTYTYDYKGFTKSIEKLISLME